MSNRVDWLLFVLLGFFWGSSYLFIKIGVDAGLQPFTLVALRLLVGAVLLATVVAVAREPLPRSRRMYGHLAVMSVFSVALPFFLITWAEQSVDSSLAAILTAPVPLFVIVIAAFVLQDERITVERVIGLVIGLVGVAILVGFDPSDIASGTLVAEVALLGAAASYAVGGVYARKMVRNLRPMIPAVLQVTFALALTGFLAVTLEQPFSTPITLEAALAVVWLGLFGSGLAYLVFFRLIQRWGATRTATVAYLIPVFGIALGAAVLSEPVDLRLLLGTALVIGGIALVNLRPGGWPLLRRTARGAPADPR